MLLPLIHSRSAIRLSIFLAFLPTLLVAQAAVIKDPDIVWAVEMEQDWVIDIPSLETEWEQGITTLKIQRIHQEWRKGISLVAVSFEPRAEQYVETEIGESGLSSPYLADLVYQAALRGKLSVFRDPECRLPIDLTGSGYHDTIVTFDPETFQETVRAVHSVMDPVNRIKAWRLRQVLAYHKKSATWSTTVVAMAPLFRWYTGERDSIRPLFWFRPDNRQQKLTSDQIVWTKQTRNIQPKTQVKIDSARIVQLIDGYRNPLTHLFQVLQTSPKMPFYDGLNEKPLSAAERAFLFAPKLDTIITINPETYAETMRVERTELHADDIRQLRLLADLVLGRPPTPTFHSFGCGGAPGGCAGYF